LAQRSPEFRETVRFVAIDPAAVYASAIRTPGLLPNATLVVDHFHPIDRTNSGTYVCRARRNRIERLASCSTTGEEVLHGRG
jgi:transposase